MVQRKDCILIPIKILLIILTSFYYLCEDIYRCLIPLKKNVADEIVLVTGAGHGIGKELAIGYALLGATVVCWDINEETNQQTKNKIKKMGMDRVYAYQCNVSDREEVFRIAEKVRKEVGDVTILINNAAIAFIKKLLDYSAIEITKVIDVNFTAHYWTLQAFLSSMIEKNHGHIVAISSILAFHGLSHGTTYCPTKSAIKGLMDSLSEELRTHSKEKSSIKFTTVYPFVVDTGLTGNTKYRYYNLLKPLSPQKAASLIIDAQRRNCKEKSIPSPWLLLLKIMQILPDKTIYRIIDFFEVVPEASN